MSPESSRNVVTRFAPSPTGFLHGGNYRTAIFAYLFAKKQGGQFIVRIEDTDRERSKKEYEDDIWDTIHWLSLAYDKKFRQSEHASRHTELLRKLIAEEKAYVSKEEPKKPGDRTEVIRLKNPGTSVSFTDAIRGEITMDTSDLGDFIIARSETEPVFHFAVVVDDADEGVTHVIRGEDHISNTPRQILIQRALGLQTPVYAHLPLVLATDRSKLSKRKGAKALTEYRSDGYLPEAIINYLALIGWHPEGEQEIFSAEELVSAFSLERVQKSAGIFDDVKLTWFNHEHLKRLSDEDYTEKATAFLKTKNTPVPEYLSSIVPLLKERAQTFGEVHASLTSGEYNFLGETVNPTKEMLLGKAKADAGAVGEHLTWLEKTLSDLPDEDFTEAGVKNAVFSYAEKVGKSAVLWPMRVALSGKEKSPDPFILSRLLGKKKTLQRLEAALHMVK